MTKPKDKDDNTVEVGGVRYPRSMVSNIELEDYDYYYPSPPEALQTSLADDRRRDTEDPSEKEFLTEADVAHLLHISEDKVRLLVNEKRLGCIQISPNIRRFTTEIIEEFKRQETGLSGRKGPDAGKILAPPSPQGMTIEESRKLLREIRKKD